MAANKIDNNSPFAKVALFYVLTSTGLALLLGLLLEALSGDGFYGVAIGMLIGQLWWAKPLLNFSLVISLILGALFFIISFFISGAIIISVFPRNSSDFLLLPFYFLASFSLSLALNFSIRKQ